MAQKETEYRSVTRNINHLGNAVAAGVSSVVNTGISYPFDMVKTRFQIQEEVVKKRTFGATFSAMNGIVKKEGYRGLFRGVSLGMTGSVVAWSCYMFGYSYFKTELERNGYPLSSRYLALASVAAGFFECLDRKGR